MFLLRLMQVLLLRPRTHGIPSSASWMFRRGVKWEIYKDLSCAKLSPHGTHWWWWDSDADATIFYLPKDAQACSLMRWRSKNWMKVRVYIHQTIVYRICFLKYKAYPLHHSRCSKQKLAGHRIIRLLRLRLLCLLARQSCRLIRCMSDFWRHQA